MSDTTAPPKSIIELRCEEMAKEADDRVHEDAIVCFSNKRNTFFWALPDSQYLFDVGAQVPTWKAIKINAILRKWNEEGKYLWEHKAAHESQLVFIKK